MASKSDNDLMDALLEYPNLPQDVCIGRNGPADKVRWLIRRLQGFERQRRGDLRTEWPPPLVEKEQP